MERWSGAAVAVWRHKTSVELFRTVCFVHESLLVSKLCMWPAGHTQNFSEACDLSGYFCSSCKFLKAVTLPATNCGWADRLSQRPTGKTDQY